MEINEDSNRDPNYAAPDSDNSAPLVEQTHILSPTAPSWSREVAASLGARPSRASSIISTRTRFSINTLQEDSRSIDLDLAGQLFRISRDGSKVTSAGPPPPYTGPQDPLNVDDQYHLHASSRSRSSTHEAQSRWPSLATRLRSSIPGSGEIHTPSAVEHPVRKLEQAAAINPEQDPPSRNPSYKEGADSITVAPMSKQRRTVSQNDVPDWSKPPYSSSPLRRRNGIRLPKIVTDCAGTGDNPERGSQSAHETMDAQHPLYGSHSAAPALPSGRVQSSDPGSPLYYGPHATGFFPTSSLNRPRATPEPPPKDKSSPEVRNPDTPDEPTTSAVDTTDGIFIGADNENEVSLHYTRMIRFIDRDHRRALHAKDKELAQLRERLNEVDTVYRQQLKARDFVIDDLKKRLTHLEETQEEMIEKARNQIEDLWEARWKEQEHHLMERLRRLELVGKRVSSEAHDNESDDVTT